MSDESLVVLDPSRVTKKYAGVRYTEALAAEICDHVAASNRSLKTLCRQHPHWPPPHMIFAWRRQHKSFDQIFRCAMQARAAECIFECVEIADDDSRDMVELPGGGTMPNNAAIRRDDLRIKTRERHAARLDPANWGEKIDIHATLGFQSLDEALPHLK
jgi:hypothetical protein